MDIKKIESLVKEYQKISKGSVDFDKHTWYSITHHSTSIEGCTLTGPQVVKLLDYGKPAPGKPFEHHLMVTDYFAALQFVIDKAGENILVTPLFIKTLGSMVMKNTGSVINTMAGSYDTSAGDFRKGTVRAGTRIFPDYKKVPKLIAEMCERANNAVKSAKTFDDRCNIAFSLHFDMLSVHPFGDGNGRTSRLLMNFIQARFNLPLSVVYKSDRIKYIDSLEAARKVEDMKPFYEFIYGQYSKFLKQEIKEFKK